MNQKYLVWAGVGVVAVVLLMMARGASSEGGTRLTTLGPMPAGGDSDAVYQAREGAFGILAGVTESLGLGGMRAATDMQLAGVQREIEGKRIDAALEAAKLQAQTAIFSANAAAKSSQTGDMWDAFGRIGESIIGVLSGGGGNKGRDVYSFNGPRGN